MVGLIEFSLSSNSISCFFLAIALTLISGAKRWAGSILLGLTCLECSSNRFLASYSIWFHQLLSHIRHPSTYEPVNMTSCSSISSLLARLSGYSNLKKVGTLHAGKLIRPVMKLFEERFSEAVLEGAVSLLCTIITFFPSSIGCKYESAQAAIISTIISGRLCSVNVLKKYAHCLALLTKSSDEESWSETMQTILMSIDVLLNEALESLEQETNLFGAISLLVSRGKDPLDFLGGQTMLDLLSNLKRRRAKQLLIGSVPTLMLCCCIMLTKSCPVQVTVPVSRLLTLVGRVLMVDGSLGQGLLTFTTTLQQESICFALPVLHLYSLDLLTAIIKGVHSQLLPHAAEIVRLLTEYFRGCALPKLRIKVYLTVKILLISMGVGVALYISQEIINNTFVDLDSVAYRSGMESYNTYSRSTSEDVLHPLNASSRKRKHATSTDSLEDLGGVGLEVEIVKENPTLTSLKTAALEALKVLLTVGGALGSECLRSDVDLLLINVATNAFDVEWTNEEDSDYESLYEPTSTWEDFQLAALRALLASLLSSAPILPRYLYEGLELFRKGKQKMGTKGAEFCAHALLVSEMLQYPRYLPIGSPSARQYNLLQQPYFNKGISDDVAENLHPRGENDAPVPFLPCMDNIHDKDAYLHNIWPCNVDEIETPQSNPNENVKYSDGSCGAYVPEENKQGRAEQFSDVISVKGADVSERTCTTSEN